MTGHVLLIDGSPDFLKQFLRTANTHASDSEESLQLLIMIVIIRLVFPDDKDEIISVISACKTWDDKIDKLLEFSKDHNTYSEEYIRKMSLSIYLRTKMVIDLDLNSFSMINSSITLVRPTDAVFSEIVEDYHLTKYTKGKVFLKFAEGNHTSILDNKKIVDYIHNIITL